MRYLFVVIFSHSLVISFAQSPNFTLSQLEQKPYNNNRILVVSGGGARGAWGAGFAEYLVNQNGGYKTVYGTSTGSLMAPLLVLKDFKTLKTAYTSVNQRSIFNVNPFKTSGKNEGNLKGLKAIWRVLIGKSTLGETQNLRKLIDNFLPQSKYDAIRNSPEKLSFVVTVVDFRTGEAYYKSSSDISDYKTMGNWIWASANEPLFMSYYDDTSTIQKEAFVDGGVRQNVPVLAALQYAMEHPEITDIDVIINKPRDPIKDKEWNNRNILKGLLRLIEIWGTQIRDDNIDIAKLTALTSGGELARVKLDGSFEIPKAVVFSPASYVRINTFYYPSAEFTSQDKNELIFNMQRMGELWDIGTLGKTDPPALQLPMFIPKENIPQLIREFQKVEFK